MVNSLTLESLIISQTSSARIADLFEPLGPVFLLFPQKPGSLTDSKHEHPSSQSRRILFSHPSLSGRGVCSSTCFQDLTGLGLSLQWQRTPRRMPVLFSL